MPCHARINHCLLFSLATPLPASAEGGALYALGLIHTSHGRDVRQFLLDSLRASQNEVGGWFGGYDAMGRQARRQFTGWCHAPRPTLTELVVFLPPPMLAPSQVIQHGACLGLGIAALGTEDEEAFEDIKNVLYMDNAGGLGLGC